MNGSGSLCWTWEFMFLNRGVPGVCTRKTRNDDVFGTRKLSVKISVGKWRRYNAC